MKLYVTHIHELLFMCGEPCDHVPIRSWPLLQARSVMREALGITHNRLDQPS